MNNRDLKADLELCKKYKDNIGPWLSKDGFPTKHLVGAATFLNQAREGWPHVIERAMRAEAEVERLRGELEQLLEIAFAHIPDVMLEYGYYVDASPKEDIEE